MTERAEPAAAGPRPSGARFRARRAGDLPGGRRRHDHGAAPAVRAEQPHPGSGGQGTRPAGMAPRPAGAGAAGPARGAPRRADEPVPRLRPARRAEELLPRPGLHPARRGRVRAGRRRRRLRRLGRRHPVLRLPRRRGRIAHGRQEGGALRGRVARRARRRASAAGLPGRRLHAAAQHPRAAAAGAPPVRGTWPDGNQRGGHQQPPAGLHLPRSAAAGVRAPRGRHVGPDRPREAPGCRRPLRPLPSRQSPGRAAVVGAHRSPTRRSAGASIPGIRPGGGPGTRSDTSRGLRLDRVPG